MTSCRGGFREPPSCAPPAGRTSGRPPDIGPQHSPRLRLPRPGRQAVTGQTVPRVRGIAAIARVFGSGRAAGARQPWGRSGLTASRSPRSTTPALSCSSTGSSRSRFRGVIARCRCGVCTSRLLVVRRRRRWVSCRRETVQTAAKIVIEPIFKPTSIPARSGSAEAVAARHDGGHPSLSDAVAPVGDRRRHPRLSCTRSPPEAIEHLVCDQTSNGEVVAGMATGRVGVLDGRP